MSSRLLLVASVCVAVSFVLPGSASAAVTARYTYAPSKPRAETMTTFDGSASVCDRKPCSYAWRDDGSDGPGGDSTLLGTGSMLYQTFHTAGDKSIRLTVTNRIGRASSTVKTISVSASATPPPPAPRCNNGQDDDGDGKTDFPADPGCTDGQDDTESPDSPSSVVYVAPTGGAQVTGVTPVRVRAPAGTDWIGVYACGGQSVGEDTVQDANGEWSVQWDTQMAGCSNGQQNLDTWAFHGGTALGNAAITVDVSNSPPPPPPPPTACDTSAAPEPVAGQGYTERFSDCFDTLDRTVWCSHQWWEANPPLGSQTVANGELRLRRDRANGYQNTTLTSEPCGQANPKSFQYGYFEARMRYETVQGNGPAFWLFSTRHAANLAWPSINPLCAVGGQYPKAECLSAELDVFEGFGRIQYGGSRQDDFFSGTLHRNSSGHYGEANQSRWVQRGTGLEMEEWHVYAARWTPTQVSYYIDGQLQGSVAPFDSTPQPMHLLLYNWNTGWEDENMPGASTEPELDVFVDWVRVWQR